MVGCHQWLDGHEFEQAHGVGDGQGSLVCCCPWGCKMSDMTSDITEMKLCLNFFSKQTNYCLRQVISPLESSFFFFRMEQSFIFRHFQKGVFGTLNASSCAPPMGKIHILLSTIHNIKCWNVIAFLDPEFCIIMLLLLLLSHFSHVWLCWTPETAAHQAPPSLGFSRQEHWSGWSFPSPMHESEKRKWSRSVVSDS